MTAGVLTSDTVPINWTIERTEDSGLRQSLYVQMQAAYDAIDQLGYQQAASLMTTQLTAEVNALTKLFSTGQWAAKDNDDAVNTSKSLLISGLSVTDLAPDTAIFYTAGDTSATRKYANLPERHMEIGSESSVDPGTWFTANLDRINNQHPGQLVHVTGDGHDFGLILAGPAGSTTYQTVVPPFSSTDPDIGTYDGTTVPDTALPGDMLKTSSNPPTYYLVDVSRSANKIGSSYLPIAKAADKDKIAVWDEKLAQAIGELTKNGQIEAARMQQLVNLLQILLGGASNTEAKESRAKESILSKIG